MSFSSQLLHDSNSDINSLVFTVIKSQTNPLPIQYLGSKGRIADWILNKINEDFPNCHHLIDLFAGSGTISLCALNKGIVPTLNDIQPYSVCLLKSIFQSKKSDVEFLINLLGNPISNEKLLSSGRSFSEKALKEETNFFKDELLYKDWKSYKLFCEATNVISTNEEATNLKNLGEWNLFSSFYANTYFGVKQCLELDAVRELANGMPESMKQTLIGTTISVMTQCVSSTTHLAQYLKVSSESTAKNLIKKRQTSIVGEILKRLEVLSGFEVGQNVEIKNANYVEALRSSIHIDGKRTVIYADPPYFKEHYSRYYHVLDTFYYYDYPNLTYNPRLKQITIGRYRESRIVSDFGLRSKVGGAFLKLFIEGKKLKIPIVLSYASTSILAKEKIIAMAESLGYKTTMHFKELLHSGQGQKRHKSVVEYLFIFKL